MRRKLKVATVVGTRPEIIRLCRVICKLDQWTDHSLIHTGQNYDYELNEVFFSDLGLRKPDFFLNSAGKNSAETIGKVIIAVDEALGIVNPDALLILGDTNSCLAAIPAKRRKIPIFHMEAGNRCFDQRVPEETNRKIVDHVSDINLPYSDIAREYLLKEGIPADRIIKTGSPMFEVLNFFLPKISESDILSRLGFQKNKYFVASIHREENVDHAENFCSLLMSLNIIAERHQMPVFVSTHPRTRKRLETGEFAIHPLIQLSKPLGFIDYNSLQMNSCAVLSDSGTISEESSILGFPALNLRQAHERPEAMEEAAVMMTGTSPDKIEQCLDLLMSSDADVQFVRRRVSDYCMPNVSDKVVQIIHSYTDYVRRVVWQMV